MVLAEGAIHTFSRILNPKPLLPVVLSASEAMPLSSEVKFNNYYSVHADNTAQWPTHLGATGNTGFFSSKVEGIRSGMPGCGKTDGIHDVSSLELTQLRLLCV